MRPAALFVPAFEIPSRSSPPISKVTESQTSSGEVGRDGSEGGTVVIAKKLRGIKATADEDGGSENLSGPVVFTMGAQKTLFII